VVSDPSIEADAMAPVRIVVVLRDGRSIAREGNAIKGSTEDPMSEREVLEKLRGCLEFGGYPRSAAERILEAGSALDRASDAARSLVGAFP
jgi:hypothetical protein